MTVDDRAVESPVEADREAYALRYRLKRLNVVDVLVGVPSRILQTFKGSAVAKLRILLLGAKDKCDQEHVQPPHAAQREAFGVDLASPPNALFGNGVIGDDGTVDYDDASNMQNTRVSYPFYHIEDIAKRNPGESGQSFLFHCASSAIAPNSPIADAAHGSVAMSLSNEFLSGYSTNSDFSIRILIATSTGGPIT